MASLTVGQITGVLQSISVEAFIGCFTHTAGMYAVYQYLEVGGNTFVKTEAGAVTAGTQSGIFCRGCME